MKKTSFYLIALASLSLITVSCSKEKTGNAPQFTAAMSTDAKVAYDGTDLYWEAGDQVAIFGTGDAQGTAYTVTPAAAKSRNATLDVTNPESNLGDAPYTAIYPADLATASNVMTLPKVQTSNGGALVTLPLYAESATTALQFYSPCSVLKLKLTKANTSISKIQIIADQYLNGDFTVSMNEGAAAMAVNTAASNHTKVTTLALANNVDITSEHIFYIYLPANTYNYFQVKLYDADSNIFTRTTTSGITFQAHKFHTLTLGENTINFHPGDLTGKFTINSSGRKVSFSKGNVVKDGSNYKFADYQYYATTGFDDHLPWNSNGSATTMSTAYASNLTNGGTATWFALTYAQWNHMLNSRNMTMRWAGVSITTHNNITRHGLLIFPDNFSWPLEDNRKPTANSFGNSGNSWNSNVTYSYEEWRTLEDAGCVFLPAAGRRLTQESTTINRLNNTGYYWTPDYNHGRGISFCFGLLEGSTSYGRKSFGLSTTDPLTIRFVKDAQ
ncbi:MAG: hypothetical protein IJ785_03495 [Bacteroidales bacterium]|nr:hypothetical protein [Bacteroidales bacterium]